MIYVNYGFRDSDLLDKKLGEIYDQQSINSQNNKHIIQINLETKKSNPFSISREIIDKILILQNLEDQKKEFRNDEIENINSNNSQKKTRKSRKIKEEKDEVEKIVEEISNQKPKRKDVLIFVETKFLLSNDELQTILGIIIFYKTIYYL